MANSTPPPGSKQSPSPAHLLYGVSPKEIASGRETRRPGEVVSAILRLLVYLRWWEFSGTPIYCRVVDDEAVGYFLARYHWNTTNIELASGPAMVWSGSDLRTILDDDPHKASALLGERFGWNLTKRELGRKIVREAIASRFSRRGGNADRRIVQIALRRLVDWSVVATPQRGQYHLAANWLHAFRSAGFNFDLLMRLKGKPPKYAALGLPPPGPPVIYPRLPAD